MDKLISVGIDELMPDPTQPRKSFLAEEIERLSVSIKARGILMPLRIVRDEERQCWLIVTGESRWRAARLAGLATVPCIVVEGQADEAELLADRVVENECRNDLRPLELARALAKLKALKRCTSQALAKELGISGASISRAEALLSLPEDIQALIDAGAIPESTAYEISRLPDELSQRELCQAVAARKLTRDAAAQVVRNRLGKRPVSPKAGRLACKLEGVTCTVNAGSALTADALQKVIEHLRREHRKLQDSEKLARAQRAAEPQPDLIPQLPGTGPAEGASAWNS